MEDQSNDPVEAPRRSSALRVTSLVCCGVVVISVLSCIALAAVRSKGLTQVSVTALNADAEPRDHDIPLIKRKDALPDYQLIMVLHTGGRIQLGTKPNTSATQGLTWRLNDPVPVTEIAGIRLQDQDKIVSDALVEVQINGDEASAENYRFEFQTERSTSVGIKSFFTTAIGKAISGAFFLAVLIILLAPLGAAPG